MKQHRHLLTLVLWLTAAVSSPAAVRYVNVNNLNPAPPYTSWATAATNIQDAVDAAGAGDRILVTNGVYQTGGQAGMGRVVVKAFTAVASVNGPAFTVINGDGLERCALLENGTLLSGFTLTNGNTSSGSGGGVAFATMFSDALVSNCFITGNSAPTGGGAASALVTGGITPMGGTLSHCLLSNNSATGFQPGNPTIGIGGGADNCKLISCVLSGNSGSWDGGGASASTLTNCLLVGNSASGVGGAIGSTLIHCTVTGNRGNVAGGTYLCDVRNSIVYYNSEPNHFSNSSTANNCTTPLPAGVGNITNAPLFVDTNDWANLRLQPGSPCIDAGDNASNASAVDLDGKERLVGGGVDMGAYEWIERPTHYVSLMSPNPTPPYLSWSTAATNIQDAVDAAVAGDQILVTNGVYRSDQQANGVVVMNVVSKPLLIVSVHGSLFTVIDGGGVRRCVFMTGSLSPSPRAGAVLSGFTLTNGATALCSFPDAPSQYGGGAYAVGGTLTNCILTGNFAGCAGGGVYGGTLIDCLLVDNQCDFGGGGAHAATLKNCTLSRNTSQLFAGEGARFCTLENCLITDNLMDGTRSCTLRNCVLTGNRGAGARGGLLDNCTLVANLGGGAVGSTLNNCIVLGVYSNSSLNYSCAVPMPTNGTGNITNSPLFVDQAAGNLRLQSNSPCINAGRNANVPIGTDLEGNSRIVGGTVDMGAFEFQSPASVLSYAWAQQFGLPTDGSADYADPDSDLANNWEEWVAGSVPNDSSSVLRMLAPSNSLAGVELRWESVNHRTYFVERALDLGAQPAFSLIASNIAGQPGSTSYTETNALGAGPFFYRVRVQQ